MTVQVILDGIIQRLQVHCRHLLHTAANQQNHTAVNVDWSMPHLAGALQAFSYLPETSDSLPHSSVSGGTQAVMTVLYALHLAKQHAANVMRQHCGGADKIFTRIGCIT
jgi:hypothetical protein